MSKIVLEDFNGGNGYYKINLAYLSNEQVEEIESLVSKWNPTDEDIINCIGMCLTDANEQRFKDYGTNLKDCLAWLEKQCEKKSADDIQKLTDIKIHQGDKNNPYDMSFEEAQNYITKRDFDICCTDCAVYADDRYIMQTIANVLRWADDNPKQLDNKVEPKFKVGDWIVENGVNGNTIQITKFEEHKGVGMRVWFSNGTGTYIDFLKGYHLWTIQDAKSGDVLTDGKKIVIFKQFDEPAYAYRQHIIAYIGLDIGGDIQVTDDTWTFKEIKPATQEQRELLFYKMKDAGYEFDFEKKELKKIKQKTVNKIEPKFHEGDWVVNKLGDSWHIDSFDKKNYQVSDGKGNYNYFPISKQDEMHLWTIADAKPGDVLAFKDDSYILLVKEVHNTIYGMRVSCYCHVLIGKFETVEYQIRVDGLYPATKEQRDYLFEKMREAGYEWDSENKELRKIEKQGEQKPKWTEEDEIKVDDVIYFLDTAKIHYASTKALDDCIDWLKSLKQRMEE